MLKKPKKFEPQTQIVDACGELAKAMGEAKAALDRVFWLKDRLLENYDAMRSAQDDLEIYTEDQAAAMFKIEAKQLADMRRRMNLPFVPMGKFPRYTKTHLIEICSMLEVNKKGQYRLRKAA